MRYIFVSDIHGRFDKLTSALKDTQFNKEIDTLICLGDIFDRGEQSLEILQFLMALPHKILVWGNHDYRLRDLLIGRGVVSSADYSNGVLATLHSFCPYHKKNQNIEMLINIFQTDDRYRETNMLLWQYFNECVWAVEFNEIIGTHGWLPRHAAKTWRQAKTDEWYEATWSHTENEIRQGNLCGEKDLIVGHWHSWRIAQFYGLLPIMENGLIQYDAVTFDSCIIPNQFGFKTIFIDGCSNAFEGKVNTYVINADDSPILYDGR